ncbi:MAG: protein kinase domain-containing protein [Planctomycetota bacterium]|jgi:serine/threonine protein kinase
MTEYYCRKCNKDVELPADMDEEFAVCPECGSGLSMTDQEDSELYEIDETPRIADETVFLKKDKAESLVSTVRPVEDTLHDLSKIERYNIHKEVGRGAMSIIMSATDKNIRRKVAVKLMPTAADEETKTRFMEEAQVIGQLEHPNIVPIHDIGIDDNGRLFFTMKYVNGRDLGSILDDLRNEVTESKQEYTQLRLLRSFASICNAIAFAHSNGVIHRDLKPDNIMIGDYGEVLVMDWGLARVTDKKDEKQQTPLQKYLQEKDKDSGHTLKGISTIRKDIGSTGANDTLDGEIIGTPLYMSPEQARGENSRIDQRSDIYGLGAILYEILTLKPPVEDGDVETVINEVREEKILTPEKRTPDREIPPELSAITMKSLSYSPHNRYQTVRPLRDDINRYIAGYSVSAKTDNLFESFIKLLKRNKAVSIVSAIALVLVLTVGGVSRKNIKTERKKAVTALEEKEKAEKRKKELEEKLEAESKREWKLVFHEDFSGKNIKKNWQFKGKGYELKNGMLHIPANEGERRLILNKQIVGDIRIEFECFQVGDFLNDVTCFISALRGKEGESFNDYGYIFQFGGNNNTRNSLQRYKSASLWDEKSSPLKESEIYHVRAEKIGTHLSMIVNDEEVFSVEDPNPLEGAERSGIGIYSWGSDIWYDNIKIYTLGPPLKVDIMELAERYLRTGRYETSIDLFKDIIASTTNRKRRTRAYQGLRNARTQLRLRKTYDKYMAILIRYWQPENIMLSIEDKSFLLTLSGDRVSSLKPLVNMKLKKLSISNTKLDSLAYLPDIKVESLSVFNSPVRKIPTLTNPELKNISFKDTQISDLRPLKRLKLENIRFDLALINNGLEELMAIPTLEKITTPEFEDTTVAEFREKLKTYHIEKRTE